MNLRREATKTIWKTVVFAGAMLGSAGCKTKAAAPTTPAAATEGTTPADPVGETATEGSDIAPNPCGDGAEDPCGRGRGVSEDGEGDTGRGFLLS